MNNATLLPAATARPTSIMDGVYVAAAKCLGVSGIDQKSALLRLKPFDGRLLVSTTYDAVLRNYTLCNATSNKDRSRENWRWHCPQPQIGENDSQEVTIERAIVRAAVDLGRTDWSNQVPVASGLVGAKGDRRRAIDLIRCLGPRHFQLIELKIESNTPLYAAVELLGYAFLWLIARSDRPARPSALLDADRVDLRVLAPASFYALYALHDLERAVDDGVRQLGHQQGVELSFAFDVLDEQIKSGNMPEGRILLVDRHGKGTLLAG